MLVDSVSKFNWSQTYPTSYPVPRFKDSNLTSILQEHIGTFKTWYSSSDNADLWSRGRHDCGYANTLFEICRISSRNKALYVDSWIEPGLGRLRIPSALGCWLLGHVIPKPAFKLHYWPNKVYLGAKITEYLIEHEFFQDQHSSFKYTNEGAEKSNIYNQGKSGFW